MFICSWRFRRFGVYVWSHAHFFQCLSSDSWLSSVNEDSSRSDSHTFLRSPVIGCLLRAFVLWVAEPSEIPFPQSGCIKSEFPKTSWILYGKKKTVSWSNPFGKCILTCQGSEKWHRKEAALQLHSRVNHASNWRPACAQNLYVNVHSVPNDQEVSAAHTSIKWRGWMDNRSIHTLGSCSALKGVKSLLLNVSRSSVKESSLKRMHTVVPLAGNVQIKQSPKGRK